MRCEKAVRRLIVRWLILITTIFISSFAYAADDNELFRIRVFNSVGGRIQVSDDKGNTYTAIGSVVNPATKTSEGFSASKYIDSGKVAAVAVHGIRIKADGDKTCDRQSNRIFSIVPKEFCTTPKGFGGHIAGLSGIYTDIPCGTGLFRNLAPFVGNEVYIERNHDLTPLPRGYIPSDGDVLVVIVKQVDSPKEIIFENVTNGSIQAVYNDRIDVIGKVINPVRGTGRFDATGYTGIGCINTNHPGVITISTAPLNGGEMGKSQLETRGGFQIVPSNNAKTLDITPQLMVVAPSDDNSTELEGKPPLFAGCVGLACDREDPNMRFYMEMRSQSSNWVSLPSLVGKIDDALSRISISGEPITLFRLRFPVYSREWIQKQIRISADDYMNRCRQRAKQNGSLVTGSTISIGTTGYDLSKADHALLYLDKEFKAISNVPPFSFDIRLDELEKGEHVAELNIVDKSGISLKTKLVEFFIE